MSDKNSISFEILSSAVDNTIKNIDTTIVNEYHVTVNDNPKHPDSYINYKNKDGTYNRMIYSENPLDERSFENWSEKNFRTMKLIVGSNPKHSKSYIAYRFNDNYRRIIYGENINHPESYEEFCNGEYRNIKIIAANDENNSNSYVINFNENGLKISKIFGNNENHPANQYWFWMKKNDFDWYICKEIKNGLEKHYDENGNVIKEICNGVVKEYKTVKIS